MIAARGRIVRRITLWEDEVRDAYARSCIERAHELTGRSNGWSADMEIADGAAVLGFMAAAIAEQHGGLEAYRAERDRQARWLAERLRL